MPHCRLSVMTWLLQLQHLIQQSRNWDSASGREVCISESNWHWSHLVISLPRGLPWWQSTYSGLSWLPEFNQGNEQCCHLLVLTVKIFLFCFFGLLNYFHFHYSRDAINDMGLHFLGKMKIMVVRDIERDEVDFICKTLSCRPIASIDHLNPEMLASADLVEEFSTGAAKVVKVHDFNSVFIQAKFIKPYVLGEISQGRLLSFVFWILQNMFLLKLFLSFLFDVIILLAFYLLQRQIFFL